MLETGRGIVFYLGHLCMQHLVVIWDLCVEACVSLAHFNIFIIIIGRTLATRS